MRIIPNGSLRYVYATTDATDQVEGKETYKDNSGVADLGLGLMFFHDRLAIKPTVQFPFASNDNSVSYGIAFSIGIGLSDRAGTGNRQPGTGTGALYIGTIAIPRCARNDKSCHPEPSGEGSRSSR